MTGQRLTIAFVLPHFRPGGAERVALNWLRHLDRERFRPLLVLKKAEGAFLDELPGDVPVVAAGGGRALTLAPWLARTLKAHRVDIAYSATNAINLALVAAGALMARRPRIIISEHTSTDDYLAEAKWARLRKAMMGAFYRKADGIFVPTRAIAERLESLAPGRVRVVPNPVVENLCGADEAPRTGKASPVARILAAGRLVEAKGFDILIDAARIMREQGHRFEMEICGDGPLAGYLTEQIEQNDLSQHVCLTGYCADLSAKLRQSDLLVLSSRREGFGNVIVEAMAVGCPVVAVRLPGPTALIRDGETGTLVEPENSASLAAGITKVLGDPEGARRRAHDARATVGLYSVSSSTEAFVRALES
jgi:glycosyltransferase involved in cell wall biosynthesis